jgi:hypothetical protein
LSYLIATGDLQGVEGEQFEESGCMDAYTIEKDPTRDVGLRILMGPFKAYDKDNVEADGGPVVDQRRAPGPRRWRTVFQATGTQVSVA